MLTLLQQLLHGLLLMLLSAMAVAQQHQLWNHSRAIAVSRFLQTHQCAPQWGGAAQQQGLWEIPTPTSVCHLFPF